MKKQLKLKARETAATNSDFYNLFRPIAPSIDTIGKVAQIISGLTEAITIWFITQSELSGSSKFVSILVSIIAMILVVAVLELGGRKFLQVLTRAIVWKRLQNSWYVALFAIISAITIGMGILSFNLSTNGVQYAFVSGVEVNPDFDDSDLKKEFRQEVKSISATFDQEKMMIQSNHKEVAKSTSEKYDAQIKATNEKAAEYDQKFSQGQKWASSHASKYRKKAIQLETEKSAALASLTATNAGKLEKWQTRKNKAVRAEKTNFQNAVAKKERHLKNKHRSKFDTASFWGSLFSFFVGFSVVLAFICIISTEVYRRGSGIQVEYHEEDHDQPVWKIFWEGFTTRFDGFFRSRAERFAKIPSSMPSKPTIGFSRPRPAISNSGASHLPTAEFDEKEG